MLIRYRNIALVLLLAMPIGAIAGQMGEVNLRAQITIDPAGKLVALEWPRAYEKSKPLLDRIGRVVQGWEFEPGKVDGLPAVTQTGLLLRVGERRDSQGVPSLAVLDASTGSQSTKVVTPTFPKGKSGVSAEVVLVMDIDASGKVVKAETEAYDSPTKNKRVREEFEAVALDAARQWEFLPERVAGKGVASRVRVPFQFCWDVQWCKVRDRERSDQGKPAQPSGTAVALDSVVKIKSDIDAIGI